MLSVRDIQDGLSVESEELPSSLSFKVVAVKRIDDVWRVEVDPGSAVADNGKRNIVLDEALEGARAWWAGPPKGKADVLAVLPEEASLFLSQADQPPPRSGQWIKIYIQDYLHVLREIWRRSDWAKTAIGCQSQLSKIQLSAPLSILPDRFPKLRAAQTAAFKLLNYQSSFLWGPPGTGKTTTLGALLASCVLQRPDVQILLIASTNQAVDQALVAVDRALEELGHVTNGARQRLCRFGSRFHPEHYIGRDHLIPIQDKELLKHLRRVDLAKPDADAGPEILAKWHQERQKIRDRIRSQMSTLFRQKSIVAMTAARAAFGLDDLIVTGKFDALVVDEASQLGLANVLCLLPLAPRYLFAGDDRQLSPIVTSKHPKAIAALGKSAFVYRGSDSERANVVMLKEQSRMAESICRAVSETFYFGKLRVAGDASHNKSWRARRSFKFAAVPTEESLAAIDVESEGTWSQKYRGLIRLESAQKIAELVDSALTARQVTASDLVILTPFRAQRVLIKACLYHHGIKGVRVSTVHRSQGSEALVVIFDPVKGDEQFLTNDEGSRLINVALSRAMGKLVLLLSAGDRKNSRLAQFYHLSKIPTASLNEAESLAELLRRDSTTKAVVGRIVSHGRHVGVIKAVNEPPGILVLQSHVTGQEHKFRIDYILEKR